MIMEETTLDIHHNNGLTRDEFVKSLDSPESILHQCFVLVQLVLKARIFKIETSSYKSVLHEFGACHIAHKCLKLMEEFGRIKEQLRELT